MHPVIQEWVGGIVAIPWLTYTSFDIGWWPLGLVYMGLWMLWITSKIKWG